MLLALLESSITLPGVSIVLPAAVAIVGVIIFFAAKTNPDLKEVGRISFAMGLLAFLLLFK